MKRVLLDVDGVLADFVGAYLRLLERECGIVAKREQIAAFDIARSLGLSAEQKSRIGKAIGAEPGLARTLAVYDGAIEGVSVLREVADVYVVTSPWGSNPTWTHDREAWLWEHFKIPSVRVIHTSAKHVCVGDYLVDDKTETLTLWEQHHEAGRAIQWQTPHNRLDSWDGASTCNWGELVRLVTR